MINWLGRFISNYFRLFFYSIFWSRKGDLMELREAQVAITTITWSADIQLMFLKKLDWITLNQTGCWLISDIIDLFGVTQLANFSYLMQLWLLVFVNPYRFWSLHIRIISGNFGINWDILSDFIWIKARTLKVHMKQKNPFVLMVVLRRFGRVGLL